MIPTKFIYQIHLAPYTCEQPYPRTYNQTPCQDDSSFNSHAHLKKNERVPNHEDMLINVLIQTHVSLLNLSVENQKLTNTLLGLTCKLSRVKYKRCR